MILTYISIALFALNIIVSVTNTVLNRDDREVCVPWFVAAGGWLCALLWALRSIK